MSDDSRLYVGMAETCVIIAGLLFMLPILFREPTKTRIFDLIHRYFAKRK